MLAYSEIYEILNMIEDEDREKIPKRLQDFFDEELKKQVKFVKNTTQNQKNMLQYFQ